MRSVLGREAVFSVAALLISAILIQSIYAAVIRPRAAANLAEAPPDEDALVCGDDTEAKELALAFAAKLVAGRTLDAGPLASARALEGLTAVIVNLNRRYKAHAGIRFTGLPEAKW